MKEYAGAWSAERGRCQRFVTDPDGKSVNCPERPIASGWLKIGDRWQQVDACDRHSAQVQKPYPCLVMRCRHLGIPAQGQKLSGSDGQLSSCSLG